MANWKTGTREPGRTLVGSLEKPENQLKDLPIEWRSFFLDPNIAKKIIWVHYLFDV